MLTLKKCVHIAVAVIAMAGLSLFATAGAQAQDKFPNGPVIIQQWDGKKWSDLVKLWEFRLDEDWYSNLKLHRLDEGSYLGIWSPWDTALLLEFRISDLYEVDDSHPD